MTFTQTELEAIAEHNPVLFHSFLSNWCEDREYLTEDNFDVLSRKFIDHAEPDDFQNEINTFGKLEETPSNPDFHKFFYCLYTEVEGNKFCPDASWDNKCKGCEFDEPKNASYVEVIYSKETGKRVEASYWTPNLRMKQNVSKCCLVDLRDEPSGFYCTGCGEES
jgi:hypothetical protein